MLSWDILLDLLTMLAAALLFGALAEQVRLSAILGYLLAGTLVGPNARGRRAARRLAGADVMSLVRNA